MDTFQRLRSGYDRVWQGEEDSFINGEKIIRSRNGVVERSSGGRNWFALGGIVFFLTFLFSGGGRKDDSTTATTTLHTISTLPPEPIEPGAQFLHMLIHSNKKDANLCKSLVSAGSLNYPLPSLLNWGKVFNNTFALEGGAQLARMDSVVDYLYTINGNQDRSEDVAIIVDGYDTWFQLRPDVMLERFFEINRQANNRIVKRMGHAAMHAGGIKHRVVFGTQSECPSGMDHPTCYAVPTIKKAKNVEGIEEARFLNSAFIMGEVGALQPLFARAKWHVEQDRANATVQDVFARLFGEQEYRRELVHQRYHETGFFTRILQFLHLADRGILGSHPTRKKYESAQVDDSEFNIGLDYGSLLSSSASHDEPASWLVRNDTASISQVKEAAGVSAKSNIYDLPDDIQRSLEPFWARRPSKTLPQELGWHDTSLYTSLRTGVIPATIQHTSPRMKNSTDIKHSTNLRITGWNKMWYQPHMRTLLNEHVNEPYRSIATLSSEVKGDTAWWPSYLHKWRLRDHEASRREGGKEWLPWKDVCEGGGFENEIFRDGKGWWRAPRYEY